MSIRPPARVGIMRLPKRAVVVLACLLSVLLVALQVTSAAACFVGSDGSPGQTNSASASGHEDSGNDEDCEERAFFACSLAKAEDAKQATAVTSRGASVAAPINYKLLDGVTRSVPAHRHKAPLFLQTGRLRN